MMLAKEDHGALLDRIQAIYGGAAMTGDDALAILQDFFHTQSQLFPMLSILDEATSEQILQRYAYLVRPGTDYQAYSELRAELSLQMKATVAGYVERGLYSMLGKTVGEPLTLYSIKGTPYDPSYGTLYNLETVLAANPVEDRYKPMLEGMRLYYRIEDGSCSVLTEANSEGQILVVSNGSYVVVQRGRGGFTVPLSGGGGQRCPDPAPGDATRQEIEASCGCQSWNRRYQNAIYRSFRRQCLWRLHRRYVPHSHGSHPGADRRKLATERLRCYRVLGV
ncbi:MAG: hypothetical protein ACLR23_22440 [Clostridia bacterium]